MYDENSDFYRVTLTQRNLYGNREHPSRVRQIVRCSRIDGMGPRSSGIMYTIMQPIYEKAWLRAIWERKQKVRLQPVPFSQGSKASR